MEDRNQRAMRAFGIGADYVEGTSSCCMRSLPPDAPRVPHTTRPAQVAPSTRKSRNSAA